jgi:uncharacterized membrane protein
MMAALRRWLLAGLLVLVPLMITVWVLNWIIGTLDQTLQILPEQWHPDRLLGLHIPGFGVVLALAIVLVIGAAVSNFLGRRLMAWWDALLGRIPIVRSIYSSVKQVSDTLFSENGNAFRKALLVQWPRPGVWTIAWRRCGPSPERGLFERVRAHHPQPYGRLLCHAQEERLRRAEHDGRRGLDLRHLHGCGRARLCQ